MVATTFPRFVRQCGRKRNRAWKRREWDKPALLTALWIVRLPVSLHCSRCGLPATQRRDRCACFSPIGLPPLPRPHRPFADRRVVLLIFSATFTGRQILACNIWEWRSRARTGAMGPGRGMAGGGGAAEISRREQKTPPPSPAIMLGRREGIGHLPRPSRAGARYHSSRNNHASHKAAPPASTVTASGRTTNRTNASSRRRCEVGSSPGQPCASR